MCGIIGIFNREDALNLARTGLKEIEYRGKDSFNLYAQKDFSLGHCLHSIVNKVKQPIINKGTLVSNCEVYNWKGLSKKYKLNAKNDSHLLSLVLEKKNIKEVLEELDGDYAFAYIKDNQLILARDIIGIKPLWYSNSNGFSFASERKALEKIGFTNIIELNPRKILIYDIKTKKIRIIQRKFFRISPKINLSKEKIIYHIISLLKSSVKKRIPKKKFALLFSGGLDSSLIALTLKKLGCDFTCYTVGLDNPIGEEAEDIVYARKAAKNIGVKLKIVKIKENRIEDYLKKIVPLIEDSNVIKVGVALTFYLACEQAKKDNCKVIFSGTGIEDIFAGYERHKRTTNIDKECLSGLLKIYERDTYRDDIITMYNGLELRVPFLDKKLVEFALKVPEKYKANPEETKIIVREVAVKMGLDKEIAFRKKKAAQHGSKIHRAIQKLSRREGNRLISKYLTKFYSKPNARLGSLVSSGKDSIYVMYTMIRQNYEISCMITLKSKNPDSYMFHTPTIELTKLQSEALGIPLLEQETPGEKEAELKDLRTALKKAKEKYHIEGVTTGALFSNYQRERIEKVADSLGLKIFSPLWNMDQEKEMRMILQDGFKFIITKIAAEGLDKSWLNKEITEKEIDKLAELNRKHGFNVAFEGGEAETLMVDGPIFKKRIVIEDFEIKEESKNIAELIIKKAKLVDK
ncbi:MAG: diphthine--ammonia ligase [Candidatus Nanoarchaeia archaeon]|nr:diphthine--ammonia ligase [Candidatus Nanoarchaeia archaeon]